MLARDRRRRPCRLPSLVVVDNAPIRGRTRRWCERRRRTPDYVGAPREPRPGGRARPRDGALLAVAQRRRLDRDARRRRPAARPTACSRRSRRSRPSAAVARPVDRRRSGSRATRFDRRRGPDRAGADDELHGAVARRLHRRQPVARCYSVRAVREVGALRRDLFFGFEELEFGLRLRDRGLTRSTRMWRTTGSRARRAVGRLGAVAAPVACRSTSRPGGATTACATSSSSSATAGRPRPPSGSRSCRAREAGSRTSSATHGSRAPPAAERAGVPRRVDWPDGTHRRADGVSERRRRRALATVVITTHDRPELRAPCAGERARADAAERRGRRRRRRVAAAVRARRRRRRASACVRRDAAGGVSAARNVGLGVARGDVDHVPRRRRRARARDARALDRRRRAASIAARRRSRSCRRSSCSTSTAARPTRSCPRPRSCAARTSSSNAGARPAARANSLVVPDRGDARASAGATSTSRRSSTTTSGCG